MPCTRTPVPGADGSADCAIYKRPEAMPGATAAPLWPSARAGASMVEYGPGQVFVCGGAGADGRPLNDGLVLVVASLVWQCLYCGSPDLLAQGGG